METSAGGIPSALPGLPDELLSPLLDGAPVGVAVLDRDLRFVWANQAVADIVGREVRTLQRCPLAEGLADFAPSLEPLLRQVLDGADGVQRDLEVRPGWWVARAYPVAAGEERWVAVILTEITSRKWAELHEAREHGLLASAFGALPAAVIVAEAPSGRMVVMSAPVEEIRGGPLPPASSIDEYPPGLLLHLDGSTYVVHDYPLVRALHGTATGPEEHFFLTADGRRRRVRSAAQPIRDARGEVVAAAWTFTDITDLRQVEEGARESADRFRRLIADVKDYLICMLDVRGCMVSWNIGAEHIMGYRAEEILGRPHWVFYPQEDILRGKPEQTLRMAIEQGHAEEQGWRVRKDGSRFWASVALTAMRDPDGTLRGFAKITRDLTAPRLVEEALRNANRRIAVLVESISDGFLAVDREWRVTFVNEEAERLLLRRRSDLLGTNFFAALPPGLRERVQCDFERAVSAGARLELEEYVEESHAWLEFRAYPSEVWLSIYVRDVTVRRLAEQAQRFLAKTGKLFTESLESQSTLDMVAAMAVPDFADLCFAALRQPEGIERLALAAVDPGIKQRAWEFFERYPVHLDGPAGVARVLRSGEPEWFPRLTTEHLRAMATSEEQLSEMCSFGLVSAILVPLRARGRTQGALAFGSTGREFQPADVVLAEEIGRRAALAMDNARLYQQAQAAIRAREDLVSVASHDLRSPLAALKLRTEHLLRQVEGGADQVALVPGLRDVARQTERIAQLVDFFLDVSQVEAGEFELKLEQVDAARLVREVVQRFQDQLAEAGSAITIAAERSVVGLWDRMRLEQVVTNLVGNAIKYGQGKPIEVSVQDGGPTAWLCVRDHGVGIAPEEQAAIFERFRRAPGGKQTAGFGLGLWIAHRIVRRLGGTIRVESQPGDGAMFIVELPRQRLH